MSKIKAFAIGGRYSQASWDQIHERVSQLSMLAEFPFSSLLPYIQRQFGCRVLVEVVDGADARQLGRPAACFTQWWERKIGRKQWYAPQHLILIQPAHVGTFAGRFAIAHEIGHICLHLSQFEHPEQIEYFRKHVLLKDGTVPYNADHEIDANMFAILLCLYRTDELIPRPTCFQQLLDEWSTCKDDFPRPNLVDEAFTHLLTHIPSVDYPCDAISYAEHKLGNQVDPSALLRFKAAIADEFKGVETNLEIRKTRIFALVTDLLNTASGTVNPEVANGLVDRYHHPIKKAVNFVQGYQRDGTGI